MPWHLLLQAAPGGNLDLPIEQLADKLHLPPFIFRAETVVGGGLGQPTPSLQFDLPQIQYAPQPIAPSPELEPAWPSNLPIEQTASQGMANAGEVPNMGGLSPTGLTDPLPADLHPIPFCQWSPEQTLGKLPSFGDGQFRQQQQLSPDMPDYFGPAFQGQRQVAQMADNLCSAAANSPLSSLPFQNSWERSSRTGSLSSEDMRYNSGCIPLSPSVSAPLSTYNGQVSPALGQSVTGYGQVSEGSGQESALMRMPQDQGQVMQRFRQAAPQGQGQMTQGSGQVPQAKEQMLQTSGQVPQGPGQLQPSQMQALQAFNPMTAASQARSEVLPRTSVGSARKTKLRHIQSDKPERQPCRESSFKVRRGNVSMLPFRFDWLSLYGRIIHMVFSLSSVNKF